MTAPRGTYTFLPWLRSGLAAQITAPDHDATITTRAAVRVDLTLSGERVAGGAPLQEPIGRDVELYGPGDVVGLDPRAIVRTEPHDWITNHEPNYLAHVEFYDEDLPWRYTPAAPDGVQLRPWLALIVLEEGVEFDEVGIREPLPRITVKVPEALPPADELWAWAHVHVNRSLAGSEAEFVSPDTDAVAARLQGVLDEDPDLAYSRIVCPRRLAENRAYHAFVVPAFEAGRLAGLALDPAAAPRATFSAWEAYQGKQDAATLPVYHRWYFRTGMQGDFEYLVRLLQPRAVPARVGTADIDVLDPGSNLPGIDDPALGGVLKLGGALRVPRASLDPDELAEAERYERWAEPAPHPFQAALATLVNLADDYAASAAEDANAATAIEDVEDDPDPLVTVPLYGRWHGLTARLLRDRDNDPVVPSDNWVHELNLDPRHRAAAGFGTAVIQRNQEDYMRAAWEQVGAVLEANRRIRAAQLAKEVAARWHTVDLAQATPAQLLTLTAPVQARVLAGGLTVRAGRTASMLPPVTTSVALRRATRPSGRLIRLLPFDDDHRPGDLLDRINDGTVSAAPPKDTPPGIPTVDDVADQVPGPVELPWPLNILWRWLARLLLWTAALLERLARRLRPLARWLRALARLLRNWALAAAPAEDLREANLTPAAVDALPTSPDFVLSVPGSGFTPTAGASDSEEAVRFKAALRDWHRVLQATLVAGAEPVRAPLDITAVAGTVMTAIDPETAVPRRTWGAITIPERITAALDDAFQEVMAHPVIDLPMYEPLKNESPNRLVPNLDLIPANSITLLETNQDFIEAYMVGLNHEFGRELLWREYPTDSRGTVFRQFWDVRGFLDPSGAADEVVRERLRDIPPIDRWTRGSKLGEHDHRQVSGSSEEVVLAIRGELLKKYPTAVIYAHRAAWQPLGGTPDPTRERVLAPLTPAEEANPPRTLLRTPLYEAKVDPDIYFFGFDLTVEAAKGQVGGDPGWFFVIRERPGEPRLGFDIDRSGPIQTFNDLAWSDALPVGAPGDVLAAGSLAAIALTAPGGSDSEKLAQHGDDAKVATAAQSSARWAYLLYQAPVMVAVHAAEML